MVLCGRKYEHITPLPKELHWFPVEEVCFEILPLTFKALHNLSPSYIRDLLQTHKPVRSLRSSSVNMLAIPRSRLKFNGDRAFSVYAPKLWNKLAEQIKCSLNLHTLKGSLKTFFSF